MNERKKIYLFWYNASMKLSNLVASSCSSSTSGVMLISDNASSDDDVVVVLNVSSSVYSSTLVPAPLLCCCCFLPAQTDHLGSTIINPKHKRKNTAHHDSHHQHQHVLLELVYFHNCKPAHKQRHTQRHREREALLLPIFAASSSQALGGFRICLCLRWTTTQTSSQKQQNPQIFCCCCKALLLSHRRRRRRGQEKQANTAFWNYESSKWVFLKLQQQTNRQTDRHLDIYIPSFFNFF